MATGEGKEEGDGEDKSEGSSARPLKLSEVAGGQGTGTFSEFLRHYTPKDESKEIQVEMPRGEILIFRRVKNSADFLFLKNEGEKWARLSKQKLLPGPLRKFESVPASVVALAIMLTELMVQWFEKSEGEEGSRVPTGDASPKWTIADWLTLADRKPLLFQGIGNRFDELQSEYISEGDLAEVEAAGE